MNKKILEVFSGGHVTCPNCEEVFTLSAGNLRPNREAVIPAYKKFGSWRDKIEARHFNEIADLMDAHQDEIIDMEMTEEKRLKKKSHHAVRSSTGTRMGTIAHTFGPLLKGFPYEYLETFNIVSGSGSPADLLSLPGYKTMPEIDALKFTDIKSGKRASYSEGEEKFIALIAEIDHPKVTYETWKPDFK